MRTKEAPNYLWYTRNKNGVKGPFTVGMIQRFVLIGRLGQDDEVSQDREKWTRVKNTPAVIPEEMRDVRTEEDQQRLLQARLREDERLRDRRRAELGAFEGRRGNRDRRKAEDLNTRVHREVKLRSQDVYTANNRNTLPVIVGALLLMVLMMAGIYVYIESASIDDSAPDCNAAPGPGMNWSHCQMQSVILQGRDLTGAKLNNTNLTAANLANARLTGADMAYANLSLANLQDAILDQASLKGANLRNAELQRSEFRAADLSFADLSNADITGVQFTDAILYKTIWVDGSLCQPASVGQCIRTGSSGQGAQ